MRAKLVRDSSRLSAGSEQHTPQKQSLQPTPRRSACGTTPPARRAAAPLEPPSPLFGQPSAHTPAEGMQTERCKEFSSENKLVKGLFGFLLVVAVILLCIGCWGWGGGLNKANKANTGGFGRRGSKPGAHWKNSGDQQERGLGKTDLRESVVSFPARAPTTLVLRSSVTSLNVRRFDLENSEQKVERQ